MAIALTNEHVRVLTKDLLYVYIFNTLILFCDLSFIWTHIDPGIPVERVKMRSVQNK